MKTEDSHLTTQGQLLIRGARCAMEPTVASHASIQIAGDRITRVFQFLPAPPHMAPGQSDINLSGFLIFPGFVNAHDHLQFALFPRMGNPPYPNYIEWGNDIHRSFPLIIAKHHAIPKTVRLWWGGIRNLLCGVTTVCHHDPLWPELQGPDFPVRVLRDYRWGHSLALGGDLCKARAAAPVGQPFIVHACEGIDELAREELWGLERLGLLDDSTVLVHGLALDRDGIDLLRDRGTSLIVCPSSNNFLYGMVPDASRFSGIANVALGSDSPLTAEGDLLDEVRFAVRVLGIPPSTAYQMVTRTPASLLRLRDGEGSLRESGLADLVAVRDTGQDPADRLQTSSMTDIEFVMMRGTVMLASEPVLKRLSFSAKQGLEPLSIDGTIRWLRAPVRQLLHQAEEVLGRGAVQLGCRRLLIPSAVVA